MTRKSLTTLVLVAALASAAAVLVWATTRPKPAATASKDATGAAVGADAPLAAYQSDLLEVAFAAASALPSNPHIKNRSRLQEAVVATCLELDQPRRALLCAESIDNWRKGAAYADVALHCARRGRPEAASGLVERASKIAEDAAKTEGAQDWYRDRIQSRIALTYVVLGRFDDARRAGQGLVDSESGAVQAALAAAADPSQLDAQLQSIDQAFAIGSFESGRNALEACARLFERFYDDTQRRDAIEMRVRNSQPNLPVPVRLDYLTRLAECALGKGDQPKAAAIMKEVVALADANPATAEEKIQRIARTAAVRHRTGDAGARDGLASALAIYDTHRASIVDVFRAEVLIPVAEAHSQLAEADVALGVYRRALEEATVNPNSRPRAEDLVAICCSMARSAVEPDAALMGRIRQVKDALGAPW